MIAQELLPPEDRLAAVLWIVVTPTVFTWLIIKVMAWKGRKS